MARLIVATTFDVFDASKYLAGQLEAPAPQLFDVGNQCPGINIDAQGNIDLDWPEIPLRNALCLMDSSKWDEMAAIARRDFHGP